MAICLFATYDDKAGTYKVRDMGGRGKSRRPLLAGDLTLRGVDDARKRPLIYVLHAAPRRRNGEDPRE